MSGTINIPAVCVLLRKGDKLLFVSRTNTGYQDGTYCLPSGHVEYGESFRQAAAREVAEEVNINIAPSQLRHVYTQQSNQGADNIRIHVYFEVDNWRGEPKNMEPDKHGEIAWLPTDNLPLGQIIDFEASALHAIAANEQYGETGWNI